MDRTDRHDRNPALAELLDDAFVAPVDVDTASRHLWVIHSEARRLAEAEVVAEADALLEAGPDQLASLANRGLPRAAVSLVTMAMVLMAFSGVAVAASHDSLPGDALYVVKRGTEAAQLIFVRDPVTRAELQLSFARTRLDEIERIASTRPQHVASLVADIAVTLDEVDKAPPEVAERVQPQTDSIRRQTTESIAVLDLPADYNDAVAVAMTATAGPNPVATTGLPTAGAATSTPVDSGTPVATVVPKDTDGDGVPDTPASAVPAPTDGPTPTPTPSPSGPATETPSASESPEGSTTDGSSAAPSASPNPSPSTSTPASSNQPSSGPSTSPSSGGSSAPPSSGPIVTPRPQASETSDDDGQSRSDDEDAVEDGAAESDGGDAAHSAPADGAESGSQPGPMTRPGTLASDVSTGAPASDDASADRGESPVGRPALGRPGDVVS